MKVYVVFEQMPFAHYDDSPYMCGIYATREAAERAKEILEEKFCNPPCYDMPEYYIEERVPTP